MNVFDQELKETTGLYPLKAGAIKTLAVNIGYKCNLRCTHCHVESSPERSRRNKEIAEKTKKYIYQDIGELLTNFKQIGEEKIYEKEKSMDGRTHAGDFGLTHGRFWL